MAHTYVYQHCPLDQHLIRVRSYHGRLQYLNFLEYARRSDRTFSRPLSAPANPAGRSPFCQPGATSGLQPSDHITRQGSTSAAPSSAAISFTLTQSSVDSTPPTPISGASLLHGPRRKQPASPISDSPSKMLNVRAMSDMLKMNEDEDLWPKLLYVWHLTGSIASLTNPSLMSPNGTLVAYSQPSNTKELRDQAAVISMAWKDQEAQVDDGSSSSSGSVVPTGTLETLTIEQDSMNLIIRAIQPRLLLVMRGGAPPGRKKEFKMTPEVRGAPRYPTGEPIQTASNQSGKPSPSGSPGALSTSQSSNLSQRERDILGGALHIQRKKLDTLSDFIRKEFDTSGFVMPDHASLQ